jgi:serine/threonine protein phosphatase PrpC
MSDIKKYIQKLLVDNGVYTEGTKLNFFDSFAGDEDTIFTANQIFENQKILIARFMSKVRIYDIKNQSMSIPNASVGKPYKGVFDFEKLGWNDVDLLAVDGLEESGLSYDANSKVIEGIPSLSGDIKLRLKFKIKGEEESIEPHEKVISMVINPDPKSLWKNKESDKSDPYWKEENEIAFDQLGAKHIVVASKRGRSHANVGSFRDDDFTYSYFPTTGWSVVAISDGAGSSKLSREGSHIACKSVVEHFAEHLTEAVSQEFDLLMKSYKEGTGEDTQKKISHFVYNHMGHAAKSVHSKLDSFAKSIEVPIKEFHSTLIFALFKKYEFGYAVLSFGVGDCPIALINKDFSEVTLMNWLDVGEFGGGTRFITMPEIFTSDKFPTRFKFKLVDDFSYLMMMTDGIYDPKFVVEANLDKIEKWKEFVEDLKGKNDDGTKVDFQLQTKDVAEQLSIWMDFWSPGNHDDRTLAIIY